MNEFLQEAIRLAREQMLAGEGGPFGAVIVRDGAVLARGWNRVTSANDPTAHAEVEAIREACSLLGTFQLRGCTLYASCEPCPMCLCACYWARLDRVVYAATRHDAADAGFDDARLYDELILPPEARQLTLVHEPEAGAPEVFQLWRENSARVLY